MEHEKQRKLEPIVVKLLASQVLLSVVYIVTLLWVAYAVSSVMSLQVENSKIVTMMFDSLNKYMGVVNDTARETGEKVDEASAKADKAASHAAKAAKSANTASANTKQTKSAVTEVKKKVEEIIKPKDPPPKRRSLFGRP